MKYEALGNNLIIKKVEKAAEEIANSVGKSIIITPSIKKQEVPLYEVMGIGYGVPASFGLMLNEYIMIPHHSAFCIDEKEQVYCVSHEKILLKVKNAT
jgi:hypothetical protein